MINPSKEIQQLYFMGDSAALQKASEIREALQSDENQDPSTYLADLDKVMAARKQVERIYLPNSPSCEDIRDINAEINLKCDGVYKEILELDENSWLSMAAKTGKYQELKERFSQRLEEIDRLSLQRYLLILKNVGNVINGDTMIYPYAGHDFQIAGAFPGFERFVFADRIYSNDVVDQISSHLPDDVKAKAAFLKVNCSDPENILKAGERMDGVYWTPGSGGEPNAFAAYIESKPNTIINTFKFRGAEGEAISERLRSNGYTEIIFSDEFYDAGFYLMNPSYSTAVLITNFLSRKTDGGGITPPQVFVRKF